MIYDFLGCLLDALLLKTGLVIILWRLNGSTEGENM